MRIAVGSLAATKSDQTLRKRYLNVARAIVSSLTGRS